MNAPSSNGTTLRFSLRVVTLLGFFLWRFFIIQFLYSLYNHCVVVCFSGCIGRNCCIPYRDVIQKLYNVFCTFIVYRLLYIYCFSSLFTFVVFRPQLLCSLYNCRILAFLPIHFVFSCYNWGKLLYNSGKLGFFRQNTINVRNYTIRR